MHHTTHYAIDLPNFGSLGDPHRFAAIARMAEEAGWDGVFLWDHLNRPYALPVFDPWIVLTAVAMRTTTIRLGTMITPLARRRPWVLARQTASLDHLSRGRLILGVGLGSAGGREVEWAAFGEELDLRKRAKQLDEGLAVLTGLWRGEPFAYQGAYYDVDSAPFLPVPYQRPRIPIWIGGTWPNHAPFRRAARWDGVIPDLAKSDGDRVETFRQAVAYTLSHHQGDQPMEAVFIADPKPGQSRSAQIVDAERVVEAGATWWLADLSPDKFGAAWTDPWPETAMLGYIKKGPPRAE